MRFATALLATAILGPVMAGCANPSARASPQVMASFYPIGYLTSRIVGDHLSAGVIIPNGVEPHDYDLKPTDASALSHAKLIVLQGAGLEAFGDKARQNAEQDGVLLIAASENIALRGASDPSEAGQDPHTWLDPVLAQKMARNIAAALVKVDPANATAYQENLATLLDDLVALDADYAHGLAHCSKRKIITTHAAFGYLATEYNFTQFAVSGLAPDAEPSAAKVREIADTARRENITVIFFETLVSPRVAQVIADEVHGTTEVLDPIEGIPEGAVSENYLSLMQSNLAHLRRAMECA